MTVAQCTRTQTSEGEGCIIMAEGCVLLQAKLEDSELQVKELSRQVMALERAKVELEARNRQLESAAHTGKDAPGAGTAGPAGTPQVRPCSQSLFTYRSSLVGHWRAARISESPADAAWVSKGKN